MPFNLEQTTVVRPFTQKTIHDEFRQLLKERAKQSGQKSTTGHGNNLAKLADELTRPEIVTRTQAAEQMRLLEQVIAETEEQPQPRTRFQEYRQTALLSRRNYEYPYQSHISQEQLMGILRQEAARSVGQDQVASDSSPELKHPDKVIQSRIDQAILIRNYDISRQRGQIYSKDDEDHYKLIRAGLRKRIKIWDNLANERAREIYANRYGMTIDEFDKHNNFIRKNISGKFL